MQFIFTTTNFKCSFLISPQRNASVRQCCPRTFPVQPVPTSLVSVQLHIISELSTIPSLSTCFSLRTEYRKLVAALIQCNDLVSTKCKTEVYETFVGKVDWHSQNSTHSHVPHVLTVTVPRLEPTYSSLSRLRVRAVSIYIVSYAVFTCTVAKPRL